MNKLITVIIFCFTATLFVVGCKSREAEQPASAPPAQQQAAPMAPQQSGHQAPSSAGPLSSHASQAPAAGNAAATAGIQWTVPATWSTGEERPMRLTTYIVPAAAGAEPGECGVFFFGTGQGGDVNSNIQRWIGQFEDASSPQQGSQTVNGIKITTVSVSGTYLAPGGPMMQSQGKKPNYRLLGAIAEAPDGPVFFKTVGPAATIAAAEQDFNSLVNSIQKK